MLRHMRDSNVERRDDIVGGQPVVSGTRMPVSVILREAANGLTPEEIADAYPAVTPEQVVAALEWAAEQFESARRFAAA